MATKSYIKPCLRMAKLGVCPFGDACTFVESHSLPIEDLRRRSVCSKFKANVDCPWGDRCLWLHEHVPPPPCFNFQRKGKCWRGDACPFPHVAPESVQRQRRNQPNPLAPPTRKPNLPSPLREPLTLQEQHHKLLAHREASMLLESTNTILPKLWFLTQHSQPETHHNGRQEGGPQP
ncbi:hypothetical protein DL93DRAFT_1617479 [Clavulina sp. PMI_390]|nr:hypothetical protein DL93DRAFT_1617479 [Clavulina sp. PMI_390]